MGIPWPFPLKYSNVQKLDVGKPYYNEQHCICINNDKQNCNKVSLFQGFSTIGGSKTKRIASFCWNLSIYNKFILEFFKEDVRNLLTMFNE